MAVIIYPHFLFILLSIVRYPIQIYLENAYSSTDRNYANKCYIISTLIHTIHPCQLVTNMVEIVCQCCDFY